MLVWCIDQHKPPGQVCQEVFPPSLIQKAVQMPYHRSNFADHVPSPLGITKKWRFLVFLYPNLGNLKSSLSIRRFSGKRGKTEAKKGESGRRESPDTDAFTALELSTPIQRDSIPSNQNHFRSLGCQLHVSKNSPKINLTLRSGRAPVLVLLRFRFFLKPPMRSFRILVMENLPFLRNYNMFWELC